MRVLLFGCGAIGGVIAASLVRAGADVTVVTGNRDISAAIARRGLSVVELDESQWAIVPPRAPVTSAAELSGSSFDLCLLSTKTTTLESAVREALPLLRPGAQLVCLQNGLPEDRVAGFGVAPERLLGCVVGFGATLGQSGQSRRTSSGGLTLGRALPYAGRPAKAADDAPLREVAGLLSQAFPVKLVDDLRPSRWSKLAINCATSTLGAAGGDTLGRLLRHRFVRRLALEVWSELTAVAAKTGVRMAKVAGTLDIARLALTEAERQARVGTPGLFYKHSLVLAVGLKFRRMRSSMLVAIERGRTPEIDWLNGEVVRRGAALGVPTPVNAALWRLIHDIVARREQAGVATLHGLYEQLLRGALPPTHAPLPSPARADASELRA